MRRGPTDLAPSPLPPPSPLRERGGVRGRKSRSRPSVPYPRGVMPVLPGPTKSEILHFVQNDNGEGQKDHGERLRRTGIRRTTGEGDDYRGEMTREGPIILDLGFFKKSSIASGGEMTREGPAIPDTILSFCAIYLSF